MKHKKITNRIIMGTSKDIDGNHRNLLSALMRQGSKVSFAKSGDSGQIARIYVFAGPQVRR